MCARQHPVATCTRVCVSQVWKTDTLKTLLWCDVIGLGGEPKTLVQAFVAPVTCHDELSTRGTTT